MLKIDNLEHTYKCLKRFQGKAKLNIMDVDVAKAEAEAGAGAGAGAEAEGEADEGGLVPRRQEHAESSCRNDANEKRKNTTHVWSQYNPTGRDVKSSS
jgi:hypothetical protein